jgi:hypothetical protein
MIDRFRFRDRRGRLLYVSQMSADNIDKILHSQQHIRIYYPDIPSEDVVEQILERLRIELVIRQLDSLEQVEDRDININKEEDRADDYSKMDCYSSSYCHCNYRPYACRGPQRMFLELVLGILVILVVATALYASVF